MRNSALNCFILLALALGCGVDAASAQTGFSRELELHDFEPVAKNSEEASHSNFMWRLANTKKTIIGSTITSNPAKASIELPEDGTYYIWFWHAVHPIRSRTFFVEIGGHSLPYAWTPCGEDAESGSLDYPPTSQEMNYMVWTKQEVNLSKGPHELVLTTDGQEPQKAVRHPAVIGRALITDDPGYIPEPSL